MIYGCNYIKNCKKLLVIFVCVFLSAVLIMGCSCSDETAQDSSSSQNVSDSDEALDVLCGELFRHMASSDGITLNYSLAFPEKFGISDYTKGLGDYSVEAMQCDYAYYENKLDILNSIDINTLNSNNRIMYDTLTHTLSSFLDTAPYVLYHEPLAPVSGIHVSLPVLLSEYHFYNKNSIEDYFSLLESIPDYFHQIINYEKQKKDNGLFMCSEMAEKIISQCSDYIAEPDTNLLIQVFPDNINSVELDDNSRLGYITRNNELIRDTVIPSYRFLIDSINALNTGNSGVSKLCSLPLGKEYYTCLLHNETNSSMTPDEINNILNSTLKECTSTIAGIILDNPHAYNNIYKLKYPLSKPADIINYLTTAISNEYPKLPQSAGELNIKYVHPSLENTLSPAMYITPPIDCDVTDDIYINKSCCDNSTLFTTLAHEAYPGHLYQHEYYMSTSPNPLRLILGFGGYSEGWATYTELYSYSIAGIDSDSAAILRNNKLATLCVYSILDLGIHYYGWSYEQCSSFLNENGITEKDSIDEVYQSVLFEPALYPKYTVGCLEFLNLESRVKEEAGDNYDPVAFHESVLRTGPTWFEILGRTIHG